MDLNLDHTSLVAAARRREPGALRALAARLDNQLAQADVALDGAVAAWDVVQQRGAWSMMGIARSLTWLRRRVSRTRLHLAPVGEVMRGSSPEAVAAPLGRQAA